MVQSGVQNVGVEGVEGHKVWPDVVDHARHNNGFTGGHMSIRWITWQRIVGIIVIVVFEIFSSGSWQLEFELDAIMHGIWHPDSLIERT